MKALLILLIVIPVDAVLYSDVKRLNEYLLSNYSRRLHPRINLSEPVTVNIDLYLNSVIDFDVLTGILTFAGTFSLSWDDEQIGARWNNSEFSEITKTQLNVHEVWVPKIYIRNMVEQTSIFQFSSSFDSDSAFVSFLQNGTAQTTLLTVLQTSCSTDITYYPFDKHTCDFSFVTLNFYSTVIPRTSLTTMLNIYTIENSEWKLSSSVYNDISFGPISMNIIYVLNLTRKPYFLVLNLVYPSIIICTVNSLSFLIPIASGERLSFCVSLLLTYIVFLTTVLDKLPSTDTVSLFNVFVFVQLIYSSLTVLGIIKTLGYYHYEGNKVVPVAYKNIARLFLRCHGKVKISPKTTTSSKTSTEGHPSLACMCNVDQINQTKGDLKNNDNKDDSAALRNNYDNIAWRDVARALDRIINIIASIVAVLNIVVFLITMIRLHEA
ncbi:Hypothetical predicted protein [Mytilus galloprovincialis]|uniref:Uncharacterized protein n=1 Tax=Mytilus galloprovincialis TaxID=29158 RepID=A0A8B6GH16_MYTGA|nr:Hypothetical predicted protein [Mytilus galloprovincialis]